MSVMFQGPSVTQTAAGAASVDPHNHLHSAASYPSSSSSSSSSSSLPSSSSAACWIPNSGAYRERYARRLKLLTISNTITIPAGFPARIESPLSWSASELQHGQDYVFSLTDCEVREVEDALAHFNDLALPIEALSRDTFPLPQLGVKLSTLRKGLYHGRGFFILRGVDPSRYSARDNIAIYVGLSSYIGAQRGRQDERNNYLLHLTDLGKEVAPDSVRQAPYSNVAQPFHTDAGDILSLYTQQTAVRGGRSLLASTARIYNDLAVTRPDHIHTLAQPDWPYDRFGRVPGPAYELRPLLTPATARTPIPLLAFSRRPLTGSAVSPRTPGIPSMTDAQADALDTVHFVATRHAIALRPQRGDMLFWNNVALLHAREEFEDSAEQRRHLVRLWLRDEGEAWDVPEHLKVVWENAYGWKGEQKWPIEPIREFHHVTTTKRSSGHA